MESKMALNVSLHGGRMARSSTSSIITVRLLSARAERSLLLVPKAGICVVSDIDCSPWKTMHRNDSSGRSNRCGSKWSIKRRGRPMKMCVGEAIGFVLMGLPFWFSIIPFCGNAHKMYITNDRRALGSQIVPHSAGEMDHTRIGARSQV